ncbi:sigma-54-dependent Fis family transcriptional regulator, partial [Candidatus Sumerlaeota bacterium]|nr:sigma-54-dependent Fis family transcriptional regulator [Candidatus Sumerlaeota bacterium]
MDKKQRTPAPRDPILVVDDETSMRVALRDVLERAGWKVQAAKSGSEAFAMIRSQEPFSLLITDCRMPGMTGIELTRAVRKMRPTLPIVMMTAYGTVEDAVAAMKEGVDDYLLKPFSFETVIEVVREAARKDRPAAVPIATAPARRNGDSPTPAMLGEDPSWKSVVRIAEEIADSTATVLLTGESGTGKEVLARHIHRCSGRSGRFVAINCAALPEGVLESELFGHEKGAFTGAILSHKGKFELADGGMILLDEISEIPPALQAKLLRVLQEREVHPIGGSLPIKLDFRVIATSNRDLEVCIERGRFRQDLFYRLNVIAIRLPPLRSRPGDVVILAEHFLHRFRRPDRPAERFSAEVVQYLRSHRWPGNVRELQNVIERACLVARCEVIQT